MKSRARRFALALGLAVACMAGAAQAQGYSPAAQRVLDRAWAATGGAGWNLLRGWHETGRQGGVAYETWLDPIRYGLRIETREKAGLRVRGFNGAGYWTILPSGLATGADDHATLAEVRDAAFFSGNFFFFRGRYDASGAYLGLRRIQDRAFDVVKVQPGGGTPRELWFDHRTHLLARMVDRTGPWPVTVEVSDYRRVGPVLVAFRFTADDGDPVGVRDRQVESLSFTAADRSVYSYRRQAASTESAQQDAAALETAARSRPARETSYPR